MSKSKLQLIRGLAVNIILVGIVVVAAGLDPMGFRMGW
jgi:hypothetical protein